MAAVVVDDVLELVKDHCPMRQLSLQLETATIGAKTSRVAFDTWAVVTSFSTCFLFIDFKHLLHLLTHMSLLVVEQG